MVQISEGSEPGKVPLVYYDEHGERHVVGEAAVQIRDGEVIALGKIESDVIRKQILQGINIEGFSISTGLEEASSHLHVLEAARRLGPLSLENRSYVTDTNPNGEVLQCDRRDLHDPHEWQAEFGAYFNVYCPGNEGSKR